MKKLFCIAALLLAIASCRNDITQERVKKGSERSLEIAREYIQQQRSLHEADLRRKIKQADNKIRRLQKTSNAKAAIAAAEADKVELQRKLDMLLINTEASRLRIEKRWRQYNASLEAMLKNMDDYLKGYELEKDTLKDSL